MRTYSPKASEITREWWVIDAEGMVLGRLATEVARILRGKHKPTFTPHLDMGDHVIIVNAEKVVLTADKAEKQATSAGTPASRAASSRQSLRRGCSTRKPAEAVRRTVKGMLPKNRLGRPDVKKLKVYAGPTHPHAAQQPTAARDRPTRAEARASWRTPVSTKPIVQATGRRKRAVARVRLRPGTGEVTVNGRTLEDYFPSETQRSMRSSSPFAITETDEPLRHRRRHRRWRRHRSGRRPAPRHRPSARRARPRASSRR